MIKKLELIKYVIAPNGKVRMSNQFVKNNMKAIWNSPVIIKPKLKILPIVVFRVPRKLNEFFL